ncbi:type II secretion system F family protein [Desulfocurvus vexinensis]|uniref:type II secretion system F family protein n=1 Tax=Desulfocurvus vexinensis TaxID=399548 RepID=UPI000491AC4F|nr:type II secretion system F family protein [Desulfocurvus vexinensis]
MDLLRHDMLLPLAAAALGFTAVLLAVLAVGGMFAAKSRSERVRSRLLGDGPEQGRSLPAALAAGAARLGRTLGPKDEDQLQDTALALVRAGLRGPGAPLAFFGAKAALAVGGMLAVGAVKVLADIQVPPGLLALALLTPAALGMYLPNVWLRTRINRRRRELLNAMPDALDLLVVCVEAGMGLDQALARVAREITLTSPALGQELHTVILELRAGKPRADALRNLARRADLEDVTSLVTLIVQADAFGTSIARTLRVYSDALRTTRYQRAEEVAAKMPVKLLFPLVFCILPALLVAILGPAGIRLMHTFASME